MPRSCPSPAASPALSRRHRPQTAEALRDASPTASIRSSKPPPTASSASIATGTTPFSTSRAIQLLRRNDLLGKNLWQEFPAAADSTSPSIFHRAMDERIPAEFEAFYPEPLNLWFSIQCQPLRRRHRPLLPRHLQPAAAPRTRFREQRALITFVQQAARIAFWKHRSRHLHHHLRRRLLPGLRPSLRRPRRPRRGSAPSSIPTTSRASSAEVQRAHRRPASSSSSSSASSTTRAGSSGWRPAPRPPLRRRHGHRPRRHGHRHHRAQAQRGGPRRQRRALPHPHRAQPAVHLDRIAQRPDHLRQPGLPRLPRPHPRRDPRPAGWLNAVHPEDRARRPRRAGATPSPPAPNTTSRPA